MQTANIPIKPPKLSIRALTPCKHLGRMLDKTAPSIDYPSDELKVFDCKVHGECTITSRGDGIAGCCQHHTDGKCKEYTRD